MIREFSDFIRNQIIEMINDREGLYSSDISSVDLFAAKNTTEEDYIAYCAEIVDGIAQATTGVSNSNSEAENLLYIINEVVDDAQTMDENYKKYVEDAVSYTADGYIEDLKLFVEAISLDGLGDSQTEIINNLETNGFSGVFGSPDEFSSDLYEDLNQRLYEDLVINGEVNYGYLKDIMNDDSLTDREKAVLIALVNTVYVDENGQIDYEELEKFLECCYVPAGKGGEALMNDYALTGAYYDFASIYNLYVNGMINEYDGLIRDGVVWELPDELKSLFFGQTTMNAIFQGMILNYSEIYLPEPEWNDVTNELQYYNLDIEIEEGTNGWVTITPGENMPGFESSQPPLLVSDYGQLAAQLNVYDIQIHQQTIANASASSQTAVNTSIYNEIFGMVCGEADDFIQDSVLEPIPVVGEHLSNLYEFVSDVAQFDEVAEEEKENIITESQEKIDQDVYNTMLNELDVYGNVIICGDQVVTANQYYSDEQANELLYGTTDQEGNFHPGYNTGLPENQQIDETELHDAICNPSATDYNPYIGFVEFVTGEPINE